MGLKWILYSIIFYSIISVAFSLVINVVNFSSYQGFYSIVFFEISAPVTTTTCPNTPNTSPNQPSTSSFSTFSTTSYIFSPKFTQTTIIPSQTMIVAISAAAIGGTINTRYLIVRVQAVSPTGSSTTIGSSTTPILGTTPKEIDLKIPISQVTINQNGCIRIDFVTQPGHIYYIYWGSPNFTNFQYTQVFLYT